MKVPCSECIIKARCMLRIEIIEVSHQEPKYNFRDLLQECELLREYFEINTLTKRIQIKTNSYGLYGDNVMHLLRDVPNMRQKLDSFLRVMHKPVSNEIIRTKNVRRKHGRFTESNRGKR